MIIALRIIWRKAFRMLCCATCMMVWFLIGLAVQCALCNEYKNGNNCLQFALLHVHAEEGDGGSLVTGQVFKKCFWNVCYKYLNWRNLVALAVHRSEMCRGVTTLCGLTLILLMWRIWWASNDASRWRMGFNSVFKGLMWVTSRSWEVVSIKLNLSISAK